MYEVNIYKKIYQDFQEAATNIFGSNLIFAFISGSVAKQNLTVNKSDLDTFVCVHQIKHDQVKLFLDWSLNYQCQNSLFVPDCKYPVEVVDIATIENMQEKLLKGTYKISLYWNNGENFDALFWNTILAGSKGGFIGKEKDFKVLERNATKTISFIYKELITKLRAGICDLSEKPVNEPENNPIFYLSSAELEQISAENLFKNYLAFEEDYQKFNFNLSDTCCATDLEL
jgi:hypothetical protein